MFHFNLISAIDVSKRNCSTIVKIVPKMEEEENYFNISITDKVSNDSNPIYNHQILIPFYCFKSIELIFFEKKLIKETSIARATIPFSLSTFMNTQQQSTNLELYNPFNGADPRVNFSITYYPLTNLPKNQATNPLKVYVYLTYDPPLQHNTQEVRLFCKGIENGILFDPSTNENIRIEQEAARCGPSGLTQVFYFNHKSLKKGIFFFYIRSSGYTGKVTLNFATMPELMSIDHMQEYFIFADSGPFPINTQNNVNNVFALFPVKLCFSTSDVTVTEMNVTDRIQTAPANSPKENQEAEERIVNAAALLLLNKSGSPSEKVGVRYEAIQGNRYSLKEAFNRCSINAKPTTITISLILETTLNLTYHVYTCGENGESNSPFVFYDRHDAKSLIYFDYYSQNRAEKDIIHFKLSQFKETVKFIGLFVITQFTGKKGSTYLSKNNWKSGSARVSDFNSKKELMSFNLKSSVSPCALFLGMFVRGDKDDWEFWPVSRYITPQSPHPSRPIQLPEIGKFFYNFIMSEAKK